MFRCNISLLEFQVNTSQAVSKPILECSYDDLQVVKSVLQI